jgi:predicted amidohydrolase YtcJ
MVNRTPARDGAGPPGRTVLVVNAEVRGRPGLCVRVGPEEILEVGAGLAPRRGETVLDAAGGAVIPGLHDHHVHLRGLVAARLSADLSAAADPAAFDRLLSAAASAVAPGQWLRATGWSEAAAGPLDRRRLDALTGSVPARVQHRSGAMWVLNSAALREVGAADSDADGIERDDLGAPTGRLLRLDGWLRGRLPPGPSLPADQIRAGLADVGLRCARLGLTGFTDATPDRDQADVAAFGKLSADRTFPQRLVLMAAPGLRPPPGGRVTLGPRKVILDDAALPEVAELAALASQTHRRGSAVAVHCVTAEQLVVAVAAFEQAGTAGDRIEHASVVPPGYAARLARLGLTVVTQPGFISARGDDYLREVPAPEQPWLYPCATLARAGVTVAAGTDAPFGPPDPWQCVVAAITRRAPSGHVVGRAERLSPARALRLFLTAPDDPGRLRAVRPGQPGDLCVLRTPLRSFLSRPAADGVRAGIAAAQIFEADPLAARGQPSVRDLRIEDMPSQPR